MVYKIMYQRQNPAEDWSELIHIFHVLGEETPLTGMAKELIRHCRCTSYKTDKSGLSMEVELTITPVHRHLWPVSNRIKLTSRIHEWLDNNIYGNVTLIIKDDFERVTILPKTKNTQEKAAMYEKKTTNPTHH